MFYFFFNVVEKNLLRVKKNFLRVAKKHRFPSLRKGKLQSRHGSFSWHTRLKLSMGSVVAV